MKTEGPSPDAGADGERSHIQDITRHIALAALVGVVAGVGAVIFQLLGQLVAYVGLEVLAGYAEGGPHNEQHIPALLFGEAAGDLIPWLLVVVPTLGGLLSGWLVYSFAPEAEGHGTDAAIDAYHNKRGIIALRVPIIKILASAVTLGTGGSGGREGPIAQIGAGFGSFLGTRLRLSDSERRVLLAAGIGAGIGAIFHAPLAGAMFAVEVMYRDPDFESDALIPAFIATTVAYCVLGLTMAAFGYDAFGPLFAVPEGISFDQPALLFPLAVLAIAMAGAGWLYVKSFYGIHDGFARLQMPRKLKPALGAMLTGLMAVAIYYALGGFGVIEGLSPDEQRDGLSVLAYGYGFLQEILSPENGYSIPIALLLVVGFGKILTTGLTIGSGGSGGVFGPSMVIGGSLGAVVGVLFNLWLPDIVPAEQVVVFAILGMAGFFAGAAKTPVSTLIMVTELTGSYELLLPAMWVCALAYVLNRGGSIYKQQLRSRLESPAHRGDFTIDILQGMTVRDVHTRAVKDFVSVPLAAPLRQVLNLVTGTHQSVFPVVDRDGFYYGVVGLNDIRQFLYDSELGDLAVAQDLATRGVKPLTLDTDLGESIGQFAQSRYAELPVVDPADPNQVVGMLRRVDVIAAYNTRLLEARSTGGREKLDLG